MYGLAICTKVFGTVHFMRSSDPDIVQLDSGHPKLAMYIYVPCPSIREYSTLNGYTHDILLNVLKNFQEVYGLTVCTKVFGTVHFMRSSDPEIVQQVYAGQRTSKVVHVYICIHTDRALLLESIQL